CQKYISCPLTF
nr:immunoglobulin light chain junction region [Macaca mulatta]